MSTPKIRIGEGRKPEKPQARGKPPDKQHRKSNLAQQVENTQRDFNKFKKETRQHQQDIEDRLDRIYRVVNRPPEYATRPRVRELCATPRDFEQNVSPASYEAEQRYWTKFYESFEDDSYDQPAMAQFIWQDSGMLKDLNPTEVDKLVNAHFRVFEHDENDSFYEWSHYMYWRRKKRNSFWLALFMHDTWGLTWHFCTASTVKMARAQDHARWRPLVPISEAEIPQWDEVPMTVGHLIRESLHCVRMHPIPRKTIPHELFISREFQVTLSKLGRDAIKWISTQEELQKELLSSIPRIDPSEQ